MKKIHHTIYLIFIVALSTLPAVHLVAIFTTTLSSIFYHNPLHESPLPFHGRFWSLSCVLLTPL